MSHSKPYPRIFLPRKNRSIMDNDDYLSDSRYIDKQESASFINAARIIVKDYYEIMEYVEPVDANKSVFSHRIYELLLRTATEFEAGCKGVLLSNGYPKKDNLNMADYHKISNLMKLDKYEISSQLWSPTKRICPLAEWGSSHALTWFQAYNQAKHNRYQSFNKASLEHLYQGICSLIVILAAQFPNSIGYISSSGLSFTTDNDDELLTEVFTIKYPHFTDDEKYDFDWTALKTTSTPFALYSF